MNATAPQTAEVRTANQGMAHVSNAIRTRLLMRSSARRGSPSCFFLSKCATETAVMTVSTVRLDHVKSWGVSREAQFLRGLPRRTTGWQVTCVESSRGDTNYQ